MDATVHMTVGEFLRLYPVRSPNFMWFLGAGASAAAGIPTAWDMIWEFKRSIFCSEQGIPITRCSNLSDDRLRRRIQQFFDSQANEQFPSEDDPREYEVYFEKAWPHESDRRRYIDSAISRAKDSFGHLGLAALLKMDRAGAIWTTNFDHLLEDACAKVFGTTRTLTQSNLDNPQVAISAMNESRWPLLVKLHGDFRSDRLKNIKPELESQDALLRRTLVSGCQRFGLVVAGYSGRDPSVMTALEDAIADGVGFPQGLFWLNRTGSQPLDCVTRLIERAVSKRIQAQIVDIENFDELIADLLGMIPDIPHDVRNCVLPKRSHVSDHPIPDSSGSFPVIRTNALPLASYPTTCRLISCEIDGTKAVRAAVESAKTDVLAVRSQAGVIAFGRDDDLRRTFEPFGITKFDLHSIQHDRLLNPGAERGLLYDAVVRALARELPLRPIRRGSQHFLLVAGQHDQDPKLQPLVKAVSRVWGKIPNTTLSWGEALAVHLNFSLDRLWLLLEPTVLGSKTEDSAEREARTEFVREKLATRYNKTWNALLDSWVTILSGGKPRWSISTFGLSGGVDALFEVHVTTGFSRRIDL